MFLLIEWRSTEKKNDNEQRLVGSRGLKGKKKETKKNKKRKSMFEQSDFDTKVSPESVIKIFNVLVVAISSNGFENHIKRLHFEGSGEVDFYITSQLKGKAKRSKELHFK